MPKIVNALLWLCWCLFLGVAISTLTIFPKKVANTLIMDKCHSTAPGFHKMQTQNCWHSVDTLLTLCWRCVDTLLTLIFRCGDIDIHNIPIKAANTSITGRFHRTALRLSMMHHPNSLTLCWCSFSEWGCDHVAVSSEHKNCQNFDYG